jgi:hypothetical protein
MVFKSKPFRQSVFLSHETASVARAELQQDVINLLPILALFARCTNCKVVGDTIYFDENGMLELDVTPLLPQRNSILSLVVDTDRAVPELTVDYTVVLTRSPFEGSEYVTLFQGKLAVLDPSDVASKYASRLQVPVVGGVVLRLSASRAALPLKYLLISAIRTDINFSIAIPFPETITADILSMWRLPTRPQRYIVYLFWNSADGNTATVSYNESSVGVATFSTTSGTTIVNSISRVWRRDVSISYSASSNAVVKVFYVDFHVWPSMLLVKALQASYSTTSTSYVQYTPLNLSTTHARIRRIVVTSSANARWYVNVSGNKVLDSAWGITSLDFNPPVETYTVDLYLASADGANATASIIIIYDEVPARL